MTEDRGAANWPNQHHLTEEYRYSWRPSVGKFRKSRVGWIDVGTTALTLYAVLSIGYDAIFGLVGWADVFVFIIAGLLARHYGSKVYDALFTPLSGHSQGTFDPSLALVTDGTGAQQASYWDHDEGQSPWVAEIDRYTGNRDDEYHRKFVCVGATSQADATAAVKYEYGATEDDIVYIRQRETDTVTLGAGIQVKNTGIWIDDRDDPIKVYTIGRVRDGDAYHLHDHVTGRRIVGHTIAGLSNEWTWYHDRTFVEILVHYELHELSHWALDAEEQIDDPIEERGWPSVHWDIIDYVQDEKPDGPWYDEERETRIALTSQEERENATELDLSS